MKQLNETTHVSHELYNLYLKFNDRNIIYY